MFDVAPGAVGPDQFGLVGADLGLGQGVVVGVAHGAYGGIDTGLDEPAGERERGVLRAGVGVVHQPGQVADAVLGAGPDRVFEAVQDQFGGHSCGGSPADDAAGVDVEDEGDVDGAGPGRDIR